MSVFTGLMLIVAASAPPAVSLSEGVDPQAGLPYWQVEADGMWLRLVQRLPDQSRGFFLARGFNMEQAEVTAQACIFQTVFRNTSHQHPLSYDLTKWRVIHDDNATLMKLREDWMPEWRAAGLKKPQQLAFEWALLPTRQTYQPGDYNWGMSSFNLPPGTEFNLEIHWLQNGKQHSTLIEDLRCAPDIQAAPGSVQ